MTMNKFAVKSSAMGNRATSREIKYQVSKGLDDTQSEVRDLFKKLTSFKEESQRQLSDIINGCTYNISEGIKNLVEEVCDLKTQLSLTAKERDDLLETVDKLNGEIRHMSDEFIAQPPPELEGNHIRNYLEDDDPEVEMEDKDGQGADNPRTLGGSGGKSKGLHTKEPIYLTLREKRMAKLSKKNSKSDQRDNVDEGNIKDPAHQQQSILMDPWKDQYANDNTLNECTTEDVDDPGCNDGELREQEKRGVRTGLKPIPNPGIKEAMEDYLSKNYCHNQDITSTEANRQKER